MDMHVCVLDTGGGIVEAGDLWLEYVAVESEATGVLARAVSIASINLVMLKPIHPAAKSITV